MTYVQNIIEAIEAVAPKELQESYDNVGLQYGSTDKEVTHVLTCIDITEAVIDEAINHGCQMVVSHHPLIFRGVKDLCPESSYINRTLIKAIRHDIALYCAHTNLDNAEGGVNYKMAEVLELSDVRPMSEGGIIGSLPSAMNATDFLRLIKTRFQAGCVCSNITEYKKDKVSTVALIGGSGSFGISEAEALQADAFLTGEIKYHDYFDHPQLLLVEAGHYETEQYTKQLLSDIITKQLPEVKVTESQVRTNPRSLYHE